MALHIAKLINIAMAVVIKVTITKTPADKPKKFPASVKIAPAKSTVLNNIFKLAQALLIRLFKTPNSPKSVSASVILLLMTVD